jgi:hypothetical protein
MPAMRKKQGRIHVYKTNYQITENIENMLTHQEDTVNHLEYG